MIREIIARQNIFPLYYTTTLLVFIGSFLILPTSKMVNNVYYVLIALPTFISFLTKEGRRLDITAEICIWAMLFISFSLAGFRSGHDQYIRHILYVSLFVYAVSHHVLPDFFRSSIYKRSQFWVLTFYSAGTSIAYWVSGKYAVGERIIFLENRLNGPISTSMLIAACYALAIPSWVREKRYLEMSIATAISIFVISYCLQSRSGLVGFVLIFALTPIYFFFQKDNIEKLKFMLLPWACILCIFLASILLIPEIALLFKRGDSLRFQIWAATIADWQECGLLLGCGAGFKSQHVIAGLGEIRHPHNIFLALGVYNGLISLSIFIVLMSVTLYRAWRNHDSWGLYLAVALFCLCFDGSKLITNPDELWLLIFLPAALIVNRRAPLPIPQSKYVQIPEQSI